jgi:N-formylglutamate deformylase
MSSTAPTQAPPPVLVHPPLAEPAPLVLDSPHSGTHYPESFGYVCDLARLRTAEDTHVDRLYAGAPALGATLVCATFPRSFIDANRHEGEIDTDLLDAPWPEAVVESPKVRLGKGLVWRMLDDGTPLYDRKLGVAELRARIDRYWRPYHEAVSAAIDAAHARFGRVLHLNCHSMPAVSGKMGTGFEGERHPDFVVGDRDGSTADAALSQAICDFLRARGASVALNHPYKGVELVRRYSDPRRGRHSIQLEINRSLYMDEATLEPHAGFAQLEALLRELLLELRTRMQGG